MTTTPLPPFPRPSVYDPGRFGVAYSQAQMVDFATQARADLEAENARLRSDAEAWRTHREKLDALIAFCPTCCAVVSASKDMTRDEVLFACGKAAGKAEVRSLREALEQIAAWDQHTSEFSADYGSNGVRDFYRGIARAALKEQP